MSLLHLDTGETAAPCKKENSPTSVVPDMAELKGEAAVAAESRTPAAEGAQPEPAGPQPGGAEHDGEELSQATQPEQRDGEGEQPAAAAAAAEDDGAPSEESLAQLRTLGRQLLHGWAEALTALGKLPGVGSMRVEVLAVRLQQLAREVSPAAATASEGAAASAAASSSAAAAGDDAPSPCAESVGSRGGTPPPTSELAGPKCQQQQAYSDPVDMFATAAKSAHLSYPELLHAFAASAEGLDDEALADYLFNLAMLCAEPAENELVVRPVLSLPTNSEEQQQYRRRQAVSSSAPVDAMLAAMQQQQQQAGGGGGPRGGGGAGGAQQQAGAGGGGGSGSSSSGGLTHEAIWQQIVSQQHGQPGGQYGRLASGGGGVRPGAQHQAPARSKSDLLTSYQQVLGDAQMQGLLRGTSVGGSPASPQHFQQQQHQQHQQQQQQQQQQQHAFHAALAAAGGGHLSPTRGLATAGAPLAKAVSAPERDLWMAAAAEAAEQSKYHQEAAAAAAAASANFSFHPQQPTSPSFGRMRSLGGGGGGGSAGGASAAGSGLWSHPSAGSGSGLSRTGGGSGSGLMRTLSDFSY